jgi:hypothetical protein
MLNKSLLNKLAVSSVLLTAVILSGCEKEGPAERAGEVVDDAAREVQDAGKDLGNSIEDACEDMKAGVGAKDTNC